jgi:hypothetical protein
VEELFEQNQSLGGWIIKFLYKIYQASKQAKQADDFDLSSQASKLQVRKVTSQQAEASELGLLAY